MATPSSSVRVERPDGARLHAVSSGDPASPPVLFSNSLGSDLGMWDDVVDALSGSVRAIRYDTRGHGGSLGPDRAYSLDDLGRDAVAVLDAFGIERAIVCGLSIGGLTAMWVGVHAPERVRALVFANTAAQIAPSSMWRDRAAAVRAGQIATLVAPSMERWFTAPFRESRPDVVARGAAMVAGTTPSGYAGCCDALAEADLRDQLAAITAPTTVIVGEADPSTPPAAGRAIAVAIPGARLVSLPAAHLSAMERPDLFAAALREMVGQVGIAP